MMKKNGFTLVELLAVVLIVAILSAVALPQYKKAVEKGRVAGVQAMLRTIYDSSERLAGEFGYRSYANLVSEKGQTDYSFARMDMFDKDNLLGGCDLPDMGLELVCEHFSYKPLVSGRYIVAKKRETPYQGVLIIFDRNTQHTYCNAAKDPQDTCDMLGLPLLDVSY